MKFACFFSSYNNYLLFDKLWFKNNESKLDNVLLFNVDCGSNEENIRYRDAILDPLGIINLEADEDGKSTQKHIELVDNYLTNNKIDCDWIFSFQHDCYPIQEDFWSLFEKKIQDLSQYEQKIGCIGFKILNIPQNTSPRSDSYGRGNIVSEITNSKHFGWYQNLPDSYERSHHFVVESAAWVAVAINRNLFKESIILDHDFYLNLWCDDVSHQFNNKNIATVTFPDLVMHHDSAAKNILGIPNSPEKTGFHNSDNKAFNHHYFWKRKYGWRWGMRDGPGAELRDPRDDFSLVLNNYKGTINYALYNRAISDGPISMDKLEELLEQ